MVEKNALITVIVPCYQVEQYLPACIDSILRQTYRNLEILLVDDGSHDRSGNICDVYAKKDSRIRVIHKENGGLSDARNVAIDQAKGDWITFIDSDDFVADSYIEELYQLAVDNGCDCAVCLFSMFKEGGVPRQYNSSRQVEIYNSYKAARQMFYQEKFDNNAHSKLYHRKLFESGIRYPKGLVFEDLATTYRLLLQSNRVVFTSQHLYYYLLREGSIEGSYSAKKIDDAMKVMEMMDKDMTKYPMLEKSYRCRKFSFMMHLLMGIPKDDMHHQEFVTRIKRMRADVLRDRHARTKARMAAILSYLGIDIVELCFSLVNKRK